MTRGRSLFLSAAFGVLLSTGVLPALTVKAQEVRSIGHEDSEHEAEDLIEVRQAAAQVVSWPAQGVSTPVDPKSLQHVQLLAINDFHGQLSAGRKVAGRPVGSAPVLAAYLEAAQAGREKETFIVHAGDQVGASPAASTLLQDEPSIMFLNFLANNQCFPNKPTRPRCNIVGTLGNHEFDKGKGELLRLIQGGNSPLGPFLEDPYTGARFPYVSANVVDAKTGKLLFPPYTIRRAKDTQIAFIGAVLKETPTIVTPTGVAGLAFLDEADSINRYVAELKHKKVRAIVVLIHQGGTQASYLGPTTSAAGPGDGAALREIVARLDDEVDVVVSGHTHQFMNALLDNQHGKEILVTQALSAGTAYADIDLDIDLRSKDIVRKSASIITTFADEGPGLTPDPKVAQLVQAAEEKVAPLANRVIGQAQTRILDDQNAAGESALGNLIADALRAAVEADFGFINPGGIRTDLDAGPVTWGDLFTIQPFGNSVVKMNLTGQQIFTLLNQQWLNQPFPRILGTSGLTYTWDNNLPIGNRIVEIRKGGVPINPDGTYRVAVNSFMATGQGNFPVLIQGTDRVGGPVDLDALISYVEKLPQPFTAIIEGRITRLH